MMKIRELEIYLEEFSELLPENKEIFLKSLMNRRAIERQLQILIESVIDICFILLKELKIHLPSDEDTIFDLLQDYLSNWQNLKEMKSFRNLLVHRYGSVEDEKVYELITEEMGDFDIFINDIKKILKMQ